MVILIDKDLITIRNHLREAQKWLRHPEEDAVGSHTYRKLAADRLEDIERSMMPFPLESPMEEVTND